MCFNHTKIVFIVHNYCKSTEIVKDVKVQFKFVSNNFSGTHGPTSATPTIRTLTRRRSRRLIA